MSFLKVDFLILQTFVVVALVVVRAVAAVVFTGRTTCSSRPHRGVAFTLGTAARCVTQKPTTASAIAGAGACAPTTTSTDLQPDAGWQTHGMNPRKVLPKDDFTEIPTQAAIGPGVVGYLFELVGFVQYDVELMI